MDTSKYSLWWDGMLSYENVQNVADLLHQLLDGKRYTFVSANEFFGFKPDVRTSQCLKKEDSKIGKAITVNYDKSGKLPSYASISVRDTHGTWGCSTNLVEEKFDPKFNNPYFNFEDDEVTITHRSPAGHLLYLVIAVEKD